jgi:phosphoribosylformimino-5-aminoimidazole carboxamide ribotide isomerase
MIVIPAIDLREGACVQLVGGDYARERLRLPDPLQVARTFRTLGFRTLHVVDLDAATGRGANRAHVARKLAEVDAEFQVGGGVRDERAVDALLASGAARVVVGTRAIDDPAWLARIATAHPGAVLLAADVRGRDVVVDGWTRPAGALLDRLAGWEALPLAGLLVTAVEREGRLGGPDLELFAALAERTRHPLHAAGGIGARADLDRLLALGCHAAVLGTSLYMGALDPRALAEEGAI